MRPLLPILALVVGTILGMPREAEPGATRAERASKLLASARRRIAEGTHEQRQFAISELRDAAKLDPARTDIALALGHSYLDADLLGCARAVAEDLTAKDSANADVLLLAGQVWRRYWLTESDEAYRDRAITRFVHSARLAPSAPSAWEMLVPLLVDADDLDAAHDAAQLAVRAAPRDADAEVLLAATAQRTGDLATADRLFRRAVPRLPASQRDRYADIAPLLPPGI